MPYCYSSGEMQKNRCCGYTISVVALHYIGIRWVEPEHTSKNVISPTLIQKLAGKISQQISCLQLEGWSVGEASPCSLVTAAVAANTLQAYL